MTTTITSTEVGRTARRGALLLTLTGLAAGCGSPAAEGPASGPESWSVTGWGERFEVFPEVGPLVAGEPTVAHTHVTRLDGFAPLTEGGVEIVLRAAGEEQVFAADRPVRPGIFAVEIRPETAGEFDVAFRIRDAGGAEEVRGGRVEVGVAGEPGGLLVAPAPRGGTDGGEPLTFLKEEQWRTDFATDWVRKARLPGAVSGLARIRPPAGGESAITAPVAGVVQAPPGRSWPFAGHAVVGGDPLFQIVPLVATDRSLAALEADLATVETELESARARRARLDELLALEAVSRRDVEEARVRAETLAARHEAALRDLEAARAARAAGPAADGLLLRAPFPGEVAEVGVTPGATVAAGEPLGRVVRTDAVWIEAALPPAGARRLAEEGVRGVVLADEHGAVRIDEDLRLVSVAPEISPATGTVTLLLEAPRDAGLTLGATLDVQVLSAAEREGIVIPATALVDDGGVPVVYLQLAGESFVRQEVQVLERQGDLLLVDHLLPGQRLVTRGGDAIRRSSLMASGEAQGHVH